jgi:uncharacterized membrane protein (DUF373 family)
VNSFERIVDDRAEWEEHKMNLRDEFRETSRRWSTLAFYERLEQAVIYILTALIAVVVAVATVRLSMAIFALVTANLIDPSDYAVFQTVFGMIFTVLIALEFKHSLLVVLHSRTNVVQLRSVILIALLALVRKFIIIDVRTAMPSLIAALAAAILALGLVYWLVRNQEDSTWEQNTPESNQVNRP